MTNLKVYGWLEWVQACPPAENGNRQARVVIATTSWKEAARLAHSSLGYIMRFGDTTGNPAEIEAAMANPGVALWSPDQSALNARDWHILHPADQPDPTRAASLLYRTAPPENRNLSFDEDRGSYPPLDTAPQASVAIHKPSLVYGYSVTRNAYYAETALFELRKQNIVEEVTFGQYSVDADGDLDGGGTWGANFTWHHMGDGSPPGCRLAAFDDAWAGLRASGALEILDRDPEGPRTVTVDDVCQALENIGFRDVTETREEARLPSA